jgi:hypothetical protein
MPLRESVTVSSPSVKGKGLLLCVRLEKALSAYVTELYSLKMCRFDSLDFYI